GVLKTMFLAKLKIVSAVMLTLSVLTSAGLLAHRASAEKPVSPDPAARRTQSKSVAPAGQVKTNLAAAEEDKRILTITGRVLDPKGDPLADARLYWSQQDNPWSPTQDGRAPVSCGSTDKDGHFTVKLPRGNAQADSTVTLLAAAQGFGLDWKELLPK